MATSAGYPAQSLAGLRLNVFLDGLFHLATYVFVLIGLILLWKSARRLHPSWPSRQLIASLLIGFGAFNVTEGLVDHHLLGLHHVNETVPQAQWIWWDIGFLIWGGAMFIYGLWLLRRMPSSEQRRDPTAGL
jgi:uncharacterized membrane protein